MPPNILLITADDLNASVPGCFGGVAGATPRLDGLAAEGMRFARAHVPVAVCQPSRSALMTGRRPHNNGAEGFEAIRDDVPVLTDVLRGAGYRFGILGKVDHLAPVERFNWEMVHTQGELGMGRDPLAYARAASAFISDAAHASRPWFLLANAHDPHRPFHGSDDEVSWWSKEARDGVPAPSRIFGPGESAPPGFLPDRPHIRKEFAEYLSSVRRCDDVIGALLDVLEGSGQAEETVVIFLSDHGMPFPFAKANCYVQSTQTPLVIRWPGRIRPGAVEESSFVSTLDLFPTLCTMAGVEVGASSGLDGRCLTPLFSGERQSDRTQMVTMFHETAVKERYEMRAIQTAESLYIWNHWSDGRREYRAENMFGHTWAAMLAAGAQDPALSGRNDFYVKRRPEEFYDLTEDPHALQDLTDRPSRRSHVDQLRHELMKDLRLHGDPLAEVFSDFVFKRKDE